MIFHINFYQSLNFLIFFGKTRLKSRSYDQVLASMGKFSHWKHTREVPHGRTTAKTGRAANKCRHGETVYWDRERHGYQQDMEEIENLQEARWGVESKLNAESSKTSEEEILIFLGKGYIFDSLIKEPNRHILRAIGGNPAMLSWEIPPLRRLLQWMRL